MCSSDKDSSIDNFFRCGRIYCLRRGKACRLREHVTFALLERVLILKCRRRNEINDRIGADDDDYRDWVFRNTVGAVKKD